MRIQETDRILKEARVARHHYAAHEVQEQRGPLSRVWKSISNFPGRVSAMFHRG
jgi:hypothetical protein